MLYRSHIVSPLFSKFHHFAMWFSKALTITIKKLSKSIHKMDLYPGMGREKMGTGSLGTCELFMLEFPKFTP